MYTTNLDTKINEEFKGKDELKKAHVDRKDLQFLKHVKSQGIINVRVYVVIVLQFFQNKNLQGIKMTIEI